MIDLNPARNQDCQVPSMSGVSVITACPLSPIADGPSALPSLTSSPSSMSNSSCLFTRCQPLYDSYCTIQLYFSRYYTVRFTTNFKRFTKKNFFKRDRIKIILSTFISLIKKLLWWYFYFYIHSLFQNWRRKGNL